MSEFRALFVGVGSIAKRHIRNLHSVLNDRNIVCHIDAFRTSSYEIPEGIENVFNNIENVPSNYDAIFITNPTEKHLETLLLFHNKGSHFFIEKPVVSMPQLNAASKFNLRSDSVYYVACPLRYNAVIQFIKNNIEPSKVISVRSISSSYLPDWRPGQDYRQTYSAHRDLGGGVSIDLIHEWDYLTYLFGWPENIECFIGKKSKLEIDSDDYAIYIASFTDKIVELHLDYFGRKTIREIALFTDEDTIIGDIANNRITFLKANRVIYFDEERDDFQKRELKFFLDMVDNIIPRENGLRHGLDVLKLSQGRI